MSFLAFTSYARDNRLNAQDDADLQKFVLELENEIRQLPRPATNQVLFFDTDNIKVGHEWPESLSQGLRTSRTCVCLYSPSYFNSKWCGREYQVFRNRRKAWMDIPANHDRQPQVLFPVIWIPPGSVPASVQSLQYSNDRYPLSYRELGLRQLMRLNRYHDDYYEFLTALAQDIVDDAAVTALPDLPALAPMAQVLSAFEESQAAPGQRSTVTGALSKACFVFIAGRRSELQAVRQSLGGYDLDDSWGWRPYYPDCSEAIGAMALQIAGKLSVRFQELPCDRELLSKLREAKRNQVPVVMITDPWALFLPGYAEVLSEYDDLNLANCAVLLPWNENDLETAESRQELQQQLRTICPQKAYDPPPAHHWDSIKSIDDLRNRTTATLDELRLRLLQMILNEDTAQAVRKVQSAELASSASAQGIAIEGQPHLQNVSGARS